MLTSLYTRCGDVQSFIYFAYVMGRLTAKGRIAPGYLTNLKVGWLDQKQQIWQLHGSLVRRFMLNPMTRSNVAVFGKQ